MRKGLIWGAAILVAVGFLFFGHKQSRSSNNQNSSVPTVYNDYTMAQVAMHDNSQSCWSAIDGSVYDLTRWIPQHPGGSRAILSICGTDGSVAFHGQHGTNPREENVLDTFKIGVLK